MSFVFHTELRTFCGDEPGSLCFCFSFLWRSVNVSEEGDGELWEHDRGKFLTFSIAEEDLMRKVSSKRFPVFD